MFHFLFHFLFHFFLFHFSETRESLVSLFLMLICFCFSFDFCGILKVKQDVICYLPMYYMGKKAKNQMFHFFSPNQKQKKKKYFLYQWYFCGNAYRCKDFT